jgi:hypothetical protein
LGRWWRRRGLAAATAAAGRGAPYSGEVEPRQRLRASGELRWGPEKAPGWWGGFGEIHKEVSSGGVHGGPAAEPGTKVRHARTTGSVAALNREGRLAPGLRDGQRRGTVASERRARGDSERTGGPARCVRKRRGARGVSGRETLGRSEAALGRRAWGADADGRRGLARAQAGAWARSALNSFWCAPI